MWFCVAWLVENVFLRRGDRQTWSPNQRVLCPVLYGIQTNFHYAGSVQGISEAPGRPLTKVSGIWGILSYMPVCTCLGTCDALLSISQFGQEALEVGGECYLVQIDFSAAFDRANHNGLIYMLQSVGVGGAILGIISQFLRGRSQKVVVEEVPNRSIPVVSGVLQGSVLGPLLFLLYTTELTDSAENTFVTYADVSTLMSVVSSPRYRPRLIASLNHDLALIDRWCRQWDILVNASMTKALIISCSLTDLLRFPALALGCDELSVVVELRILGVILDSKLTFERQIRSIAALAAQKLGILRKFW